MSKVIHRASGKLTPIRKRPHFLLTGEQCFRNRELEKEDEVLYNVETAQSDNIESELIMPDVMVQQSSEDIFVKTDKDEHNAANKLEIKENGFKQERPQELKKTRNRQMTLDQMEEYILQRIHIIRHDDNIYYYTGRTYRIIRDDEELLRLVRSKVSDTGFACTTVRIFFDLYKFLKSSKRLIPRNYEKRLRKAKHLVVFHNGVLDLNSMKLKEHSEEYLTFYELNADWQERPRIRVFAQFLEMITKGDAEISDRILEVMGYLLSPINQKYFFVFGTAPNSGKSTLGKLLRELIGNEFVSSLPPYQLGEKFSLGNIHGKILNLSMDLPKGKLKPVPVSIIKQITGGDRIITEQKYEKMREINSDLRFLFASNYPVTVAHEDDEDSFWNRMVIVPFSYSVDKTAEDPELLQKLLNEKNDIISLCLASLHKVIVKGYIFSQCKEADRMKYRWRYQKEELEFSIKPFLNQYIMITFDNKDEIITSELYQIYSDFCYGNAIPKASYNAFVGWCDENLKGVVRKRIHHTNQNPVSGYVGLRWKER